MAEYETYGNAANNYENAKKTLREGEDVAKTGSYRGGGQEAEEETGAAQGLTTQSSATAANRMERSGFYRGGRTEQKSYFARGQDNREVKDKKPKSFLRRFSPLLVIIGIVSGMGIGIGMSQLAMPFHIVESLTEMTDGSFTARQARIPKLVRWAFNMDTDVAVVNQYKNLFTGFRTVTRYRRNVTNGRLKDRLAAEGITVDGDADVPAYPSLRL